MQSVRGGGVAMVYQDPMTSLNPLLRVRTQLVETLRAHGAGKAADLVIVDGNPAAVVADRDG